MINTSISYNFVSKFLYFIIEKILKEYINTFYRAVSSAGRALPF
tara:strand:+ start:329 stop:460 length:132 start_codon:yes stop_codon:yes gene_type:complete